MAFGIKRSELRQWQRQVANGEIAFLTHYWVPPESPEHHTVTKVGCADIDRLMAWGQQYGLKAKWIDRHPGYPHFDLLGEKQKEILRHENLISHLQRFHI